MIKIVDGEREISVRGRIVDIIRWLITNAERINRGSGAIRFVFGAGAQRHRGRASENRITELYAQLKGVDPAAGRSTPF